jgi:hypothetical protein
MIRRISHTVANINPLRNTNTHRCKLHTNALSLGNEYYIISVIIVYLTTAHLLYIGAIIVPQEVRQMRVLVT